MTANTNTRQQCKRGLYLHDSMGAFVNSLWLPTLISEHSRLSVPERRITDEFTEAQHQLNVPGVIKHWQKKA